MTSPTARPPWFNRASLIRAVLIGTVLWAWIQPQAASSRELHAKRLKIYQNHAIRADEDGLAVKLEAVARPPLLSQTEFHHQVESMLGRAEAWARAQALGVSHPISVPILIHVHGGLNTWKSTFKRMDLVESITNAPNRADRHYPIFISWPSGPLDNYWERVWDLRVGVKDRERGRKFMTRATAPVVMATDFAKAAVGAPQSWGHQIVNAKDQFAYPGQVLNPGQNGKSQWLSQLFLLSASNAVRAQSEGFSIQRGQADSQLLESADRVVRNSLKSPVYLTLGTVAQGEPSIAASSVMKRRTLNLYKPAQELEWLRNAPGGESIKDFSALGEFFKILLKRVSQVSPDELRYEITLVGHSLGTIVLNNLLTRHAEEWRETGALREIIYMAAACSVREAAAAIKPLLTSCQGSGTCHQHLRFSNLTLHPFADLSEAMGWGFLPAGSLLYQIDTHLENPKTALDRTLGWDINALSAIDEFASVKDYCHFKSFDYDPGTLPMKHADFNDCPFWTRDFVRSKQDPVDSPDYRVQLHQAQPAGQRQGFGLNYKKDWRRRSR